MELAAAVEMADSLSNMLNEMRTNAEISYQIFFTIVMEIANSIGEVIKILRVVGRQTHRANY